MKYGSVCSGIEAASVAWEPLGWEAQWYAEIEHFPSAVLAHRFPTVPNLGDMTKIHQTKQFQDAAINLLVGGTPCQSFSVAGLRKGLDDPRGQLMYTFVELAARKRPNWVVWENVPGVLSSNGGDDFGSFLGLLTGRKIQSPRRGWKSSGCIPGIGSAYGIAWRVLDAQYYGVAQRRRRVFVVGYLGDWRPAAAVLLERNSLSGHPPEGRKKGQGFAADAQGGSGGGGLWPTVGALCADTHPGAYSGQDAYTGRIIPHAFKVRGGSEDNTGEQGGTPGKKAGKGYLGQDEKAFTIGTTQDQQIAQPIAFKEPCPTITAKMQGSSGWAPYNETDHLVGQPIPFRKSRRAQSKDDHETWVKDEKANTINTFDVGDVRTTQAVVQPIAVDVYNQSINGQTSATITEAVGGTNTSGPKVMQAAGFLPTQGSAAKGIGYEIEQAPTLRAGCDNYGLHYPPMAIRRLTPKECERLQGFPDDWTKIPYRNKPADQCPDGPRYKACGNSMAVPVMRWIGERIKMVESILEET